ncbi:MAG: hypothetical protein M3P41_13100 [Actinomycetota bacterium]|jgi:hypothetical protein|nr:hypothetical protein [Actinomycetota bacterium]
MDGGEIDVELVAASLRASSNDLKTFVEVLADKLERALPGRVQVERRATRFLGREKRVDRIQCQLGEQRYVLSARNGIEARRAMAVRGVVLKTEELSLDEWLGALARDLADEARTNEHAQLALQQLLAG